MLATHRSREKGAIRPLWLMIGVLTAVTTGSVVNKCLCDPASKDSKFVGVVVEGKLIDSPVLELRGDKLPIPADGIKLEPTPASEATTGTDITEPPADPVVESMRMPLAEPEIIKDPKLEPLTLFAKENKRPIKKGFEELTFEKLSDWNYVFPDIEEGQEVRDDPTPKSHKEMSGKKFAVRGFMIPFKVEGEDVTEFLLVRNQFACCFGVVPKMNEWIHVKMAKGKVAPYAVDIPITVYGTLDAGELLEKGIVMSLYRMESTEVEEPPVFR